MIIYGSNSSVREGQKILGVNCPSCKSSDLTGAKVFPYGHIYWIPLVPLPSKALMVCGQCNQVTSGKEIPDMAQSFVKQATEAVKRPLTHFLGLLLVILISAGVYASSQLDDQHTLDYAADPHVGDVLILDLSEIDELKSFVAEEEGKTYPYCPARIVTADAGSPQIFVELSDRNYRSGSNAADENKPVYSDNAQFALDRDRLVDMVKSKAIFQIMRD